MRLLLLALLFIPSLVFGWGVQMMDSSGIIASGGSGDSDDFTYANGGLPAQSGGAWATPTGLSDINVVSNAVKVSTDGVANVAYWDTVYSADQCSTVTMTNIGTGVSSPTVRTSSTEETFYFVSIAQVRKTIAGTQSQIMDVTAAVNGDIVKLCVVGTTVTMYINGSLDNSVTDTGISSGYPGIYILYDDAILDDWVGSEE